MKCLKCLAYFALESERRRVSRKLALKNSVVMTLTEEKIDELGTSEKIFFKEGSRVQDAEILLASIEDCIMRRFDPKPDGFLSKGESRQPLVRSVIWKLCIFSFWKCGEFKRTSWPRCVPTEARRGALKSGRARADVSRSRFPMDREYNQKRPSQSPLRSVEIWLRSSFEFRLRVANQSAVR